MEKGDVYDCLWDHHQKHVDLYDALGHISILYGILLKAKNKMSWYWNVIVQISKQCKTRNT